MRAAGWEGGPLFKGVLRTRPRLLLLLIGIGSDLSNISPGRRQGWDVVFCGGGAMAKRFPRISHLSPMRQGSSPGEHARRGTQIARRWWFGHANYASVFFLPAKGGLFQRAIAHPGIRPPALW